MQLPPPVKRPTSVISWIGFGLSLTVFIIIWSAFISASHNSDPRANILMIAILVSMVLGVMGFVFSLIGLILAIRNNTPTWIGVCGIVLCCASIISPFAALYMNGSDDRKVENVASNGNYEVVISISRIGEISCENKTGGYNPMIFSSYQLREELKSWMKMNGFDKNVSIGIYVSSNAEYSKVLNVTECLTGLGYTNYKLVN